MNYCWKMGFWRVSVAMCFSQEVSIRQALALLVMGSPFPEIGQFKAVREAHQNAQPWLVNYYYPNLPKDIKN